MTGVRMLSVSVTAHRSVPAVKKRLGAVVLELIVVLPTLFACTLVAAQFGASLSGAVAVHQASVAGVQMASVLGRSSGIPSA